MMDFDSAQDEMEHILESLTTHEGPKLRVVRRKIDFGNGKTATFEVVNFNGHLGVMAVARDDDGAIYLLEQYQAGMDERQYVLPKGVLPVGEDPAAYMNTELQEEIGVRARRLTRLADLDAFPGWVHARSIIFLAEDLEPSKKQGDEVEDIKVIRLPLEHAVEMIRHGRITDARSVAAILLVREHLQKALP